MGLSGLGWHVSIDNVFNVLEHSLYELSDQKILANDSVKLIIHILKKNIKNPNKLGCLSICSVEQKLQLIWNQFSEEFLNLMGCALSLEHTTWGKRERKLVHQVPPSQALKNPNPVISLPQIPLEDNTWDKDGILHPVTNHPQHIIPLHPVDKLSGMNSKRTLVGLVARGSLEPGARRQFLRGPEQCG